jgi:hypothetical protein
MKTFKIVHNGKTLQKINSRFTKSIVHQHLEDKQKTYDVIDQSFSFPQLMM